MHKLLFFSRVAFLCNVCFVITFFLRYMPALKDGFFTSTVIVLGLVLSIVLNAVISLLYLFVKVSGKSVVPAVPLWLIITNFLFFVFQAILLFK